MFDLVHITFNTLQNLPPLQHELRCKDNRSYKVLFIGVGDDSAEPLLSDTHVAHQSLNPWLGRLTRSQRPFPKLLRFVEFILRGCFALLSTPSKVIVAHDLPAALPGWLASRITGRVLIYHAHEMWGEANGVTAPGEGLWRAVDRFLCRNAHAMIAPEPHRAHIYHEEYGAPNLPVIVPNCPPLQFPHPQPVLREALPESWNSSLLVLYQGLLDPGRCLDALIDAFTLLPEHFALVLMGRGNPQYKEHLLHKISALHLEHRIRILPPVPYTELHAWTCGADIGVLLYKNDCRNNRYCAPNKIHEYLQAGIPVVGAELPGLSRLVDEDVGIVADPDSPQALAKAFLTLENPSRREDIRIRALQLAKDKYHWDVAARDLWTLYTRFFS